MDTLKENLIDHTQLTPAKRALLEMRLRGNTPQRTAAQTIEKRPEDSDSLLSFAQQRLWFLHQMAPESAAYNMSAAFRLEGVLDLSALEEAFNGVVHRHEVLRTTYDETDGEPIPRINPVPREMLTILDLQSLNKSAQDIRVKLLAKEEAEHPFDLKIVPLVRIRLLKLGELDHVLLVTLHHIVCDGWSIGIFVREIAELYDALISNRSSLLPKLPIQYADFAYWQRQQLQGKALEQQLEYWQQKLSNLPILDFPTDYPRSETPTYQGAFQSFISTEAITSRLKVLSTSSGATLFTTLLAIFSILLQRYTGQSDIVTGTVIANRNRAEIENLIGFFVNALPLRLDLRGNPTFQELLVRSKKVVQEAYDHQDLPFDRLVQDLRLPRDTSRNPVFQVSLDLDNTPQASATLRGLQISSLELDIDTTQFDLTVHFNEQDGKLNGLVAYNTTLFSSVRMQSLCKHLENLLEAVASDPGKRLSEFSLLTESELRQLTIDWNQTEADYPDNRCIHELFETQVKNNPDAAAVVFENERLSYAQLNAKANQLARYLRKMGVKPEVVVGICIERSLEMIIGILGILKAGGVYFPIDPSYPEERKAFLLADGAPAVVLTQMSLLNAIPPGDVKCVCLDRDWSLVAEQSTENLPSVSTPANLAYVIYTSGSTGKPKGVAISHRNVVHSTAARLNYYKVPIEGFLLLPSFAFDSSVAGIFWTLSQGGCLCLPHQNSLIKPAELARKIAEEKITHLLCLPSFYQLLLEQDNKHSQLDSLRTVIVAGEACAAGLIRNHYEILPGVSLFNEYGPTEGTVWASVRDLQPEDAQNTVSIGRPINNVEIYLLDASFNLAPPGIKGELYIGGAGLARGYLNHPDQTATRFIPHPFKHEGDRLYKTGDLARFQANGSLEFLGRVDSQVKIRGFRIELGEIEACLMQLPEIKETAILVREYAPGDRRLVAFCVPASNNYGESDKDQIFPGGESIRSQLKLILPEYMVPSAFVFMNELPLTPNGKIDRNALLLGDIDLSSRNQYEVPRNSTEKALVQIWSEILGIDRIGIHNNFFELGGHSLLTTRVINQVNDQFNLDLDVIQIFKRPTIAQLAELIDNCDAMMGLERNPEQIDLMMEANLDPSIRPINHPDSYCQSPRTIFLTGATGFLGVFLLYELLQQTSAKVLCLVRAKSVQEGYEKLKSALEQYEIFDPGLMHRVLPICGDLASSRFGLSMEQFDQLAEEIDVIYHNGALVNFVQSYKALKAANVMGTQEILRLASVCKIKPMHYVSTLSVFGSGATTNSDSFTEDDFPDPDFDREDGYGQTKWVAEQLVRVAADRGFPVTIHRPATVTGHSDTGVWNTDNFLCRLIRGCIDIGKAPVEQMSFDIVPVDFVSKAIVYLSQQPQAIGKTFHFNNKLPVSSKDIIQWVNELGYTLHPVSFTEWRENVRGVSHQSPDHPLYPLLSMFEDVPTDDAQSVEKRKEYSTIKTEEALLESSVQCPSVDRALFAAYLAYLQRSGLIKQSY